jgi:hypothetical protein
MTAVAVVDSVGVDDDAGFIGPQDCGVVAPRIDG